MGRTLSRFGCSRGGSEVEYTTDIERLGSGTLEPYVKRGTDWTRRWVVWKNEVGVFMVGLLMQWSNDIRRLPKMSGLLEWAGSMTQS